MNGQIKKYIYIIGTICIVFLVGTMVFKILPWLILAGFIAYIGMKVMGFVKGRKQKKNSDKFDFKNKNDTVDSYDTSTDYYADGEVIDVEYEEVNKGK